MKNLLIVTILLFGNCYSQDLKNLVIPSMYTKVAQAEGDLDKDGINEIVFAYETNSVDKDSFFTKELYICKVIDKQLKLWKKNTTVLFSRRDSFEREIDNTPNLKIANSTLIIEQTFHGSTRSDDFYKNVFRFQNNDWYLIGATTITQYNCLYEDIYDVNFSTGEAIVKWKNQCCSDINDCDENKPDKKTSFKYNFRKILMDKFKPGETEVSIPKSKKVFRY